VRAEADRQSVMQIAAVNDREEVVLMCHLRVKSLRLPPFKIGYVQAGPLVLGRGGVHPEIEEALRALRDAGHALGISVLRIAPNVARTEIGAKIEQTVTSAGFTRSPVVAPYHTLLVSLKESEEQIRARIDRESRRVLRKAEALPLEVQVSTSPESFSELERLYAGAKSRKGFLGLDSREFAAMQQRLEAKDKAMVLLARYEGQCVTAHATTHWGNTAVPILTASNEAGLRLGTSYLLWWKAYCMAKEMGMEYYDLGGVDPKVNPKGYLFKRRMGGEETHYLGAYDSCSSGLMRSLWTLSERGCRFLKARRRPCPETAAG
jgi:lipid II:glycine glycyltransferase (peptidoglycan interpeptide bridge formation enzyme)